MKKSLIDYSELVDDAMHLIVKKSLQLFAGSDSRGEHHFFISFITKYPGVVLSEKLRQKYPYEMTIVLQHQFEDLNIYDDYFTVVLSFDNLPERVVVPFTALTAFADPSVKFGLQFRHIDEWNEEESDTVKEKSAVKKDATNKAKKRLAKNVTEEEANDSNIISLDFHNKKRI